MAEFQWWLLLVGLVAGGGLVAVLYLESARHEADVDEEELPAEAAWIADRMRNRGRPVDAGSVEQVLLDHQAYLGLPPPDRLVPVAPGATRDDTTGTATGIHSTED
ncbi:MAG: hypothetical protein ABI555_07750 [Chloroflexota bacterium]